MFRAGYEHSISLGVTSRKSKFHGGGAVKMALLSVITKAPKSLRTLRPLLQKVKTRATRGVLIQDVPAQPELRSEVRPFALAGRKRAALPCGTRGTMIYAYPFAFAWDSDGRKGAGKESP